MLTNTLLARLRNLFLLVVLLGIVLSGVATSSVAAQPSAPNALGKADDQPVSSPEISSAQRKEWTREEMLSAVPYPLEKKADKVKDTGSVPSAEGPLTVVAPQLPKVKKSDKKGTDPLPTRGDASALYASGLLDPSQYGIFPFSTVGKVFFTDNGVNYACSASVAGNNSVWTAGHCVFNSVNKTWHTNWVFVPGYYDGYAPNGYWYARELWSLNGWLNGYNNFAYDIGMAVLYRDGYGYSVTDRFGAMGFMANYSRNQYFTVFGYPAAYPYNGERMAWCQDPLRRVDNSFNPATNGIGCDHTGGTSGGPWVVQYTYNSYSGNYVNGVNSYKYNNDPYSIYSPYFGDGAINLFNTVIPR